MKNLFHKDKQELRELICYIIAGVLTTAVNIASYEGLRLLMPWGVANPLAWCVSVVFAYFVNRRFVFHTQGVRGKAMLREAGLFIAARLLSLALDQGCMWLCMDLFHINDHLAKYISNVLVIIANYVASKLVIFKKKA